MNIERIEKLTIIKNYLFSFSLGSVRGGQSVSQNGKHKSSSPYIKNGRGPVYNRVKQKTEVPFTLDLKMLTKVESTLD